MRCNICRNNYSLGIKFRILPLNKLEKKLIPGGIKLFLFSHKFFFKIEKKTKKIVGSINFFPIAQKENYNIYLYYKVTNLGKFLHLKFSTVEASNFRIIRIFAKIYKILIQIYEICESYYLYLENLYIHR